MGNNKTHRSPLHASASAAALAAFLCLLACNPAAADVLELADGSCLEGEIVAEAAGFVSIKLANGRREVVARAKVGRVRKGVGLADVYMEKAPSAAEAGPKGLLDLGDWCMRHGLRGLAVLCFRRAVAADSGFEEARKRLGHVQWEGTWYESEAKMMLGRGFSLVRGEWVSGEYIAEKTAGLVEIGGDWFTEAEAARIRDGGAVGLPSADKRLVARTAHYRLFCTLSGPRMLRFAGIAEQAYAAFREHFRFEPDRVMEGDVFGDLAEFEDFAVGFGMAMPGRLYTHGFFSGEKIHFPYVDDDYTSINYLVHELCHQFEGLSGRPVNAAPWYFEGIACFFGNHVFENGRLHAGALAPSKNSNLYYLHHMVKTGGAWPLRKIIEGSPGPTVDRDFYNHAWGLVWFLSKCADKGYPEKFRAFEAQVHSKESAGKDPVAMFEEFFGRVEEVEKDFLAFIASIKGIPWRGTGKPAGGK